MAIRTLSVSLAVVMGLAACAAPSQPFLDQARSGCTAGNQDACQHIAPLQAQVNAEHAQQAQQTAAALAVIAGAAAIGYAASRPAPVYYTPVIVCRWNCW